MLLQFKVTFYIFCLFEYATDVCSLYILSEQHYSCLMIVNGLLADSQTLAVCCETVDKGPEYRVICLFLPVLSLSW